jgi:glutaminyl-tRNA synthetase
MAQASWTTCSAPVHPHHPELGRREFASWAKNCGLRSTDYEEVPPKGYNRLYPGNKRAA